MAKAQIAFAAGLGLGLVGGGQLAAHKNDANEPPDVPTQPGYVAQIERLVARTHFENVRLKQELEEAHRDAASRKAGSRAYAAGEFHIDQTDRSG